MRFRKRKEPALLCVLRVLDEQEERLLFTRKTGKNDLPHLPTFITWQARQAGTHPPARLMWRCPIPRESPRAAGRLRGLRRYFCSGKWFIR